MSPITSSYLLTAAIFLFLIKKKITFTTIYTLHSFTSLLYTSLLYTSLTLHSFTVDSFTSHSFTIHTYTPDPFISHSFTPLLYLQHISRTNPYHVICSSSPLPVLPSYNANYHQSLHPLTHLYLNHFKTNPSPVICFP